VAQKSKTETPVGWEPVEDTSTTAGWEPVEEDAKLVSQFSAPANNKEGIYRMKSPYGTDVLVPYSKVMLASKAGFKIHPDDRTTYADEKSNSSYSE
jgi:hypothetical protein